MVIHEKRYTAEEFWDITQLPENENKRLELIDGFIHEKGLAADMASSSKKNTVVAGRVLNLMNRMAVPANIAVEVISPGETARKVMDKTRMYLDAGAAFVWNIYPDEELVDVCHLNADGSMTIQTLSADDTLSGGDVLSGFTLSVREIFPT